VNPTRDEQIEGAIYIAKKHRRDIELVGIWLGFFLVISALAWGVTHAIDALPHSHPISVCQTVAQCQRYILAHPIHVKPMPGFPVFTGPTP
jgi:hypothetical protein